MKIRNIDISVLKKSCYQKSGNQYMYVPAHIICLKDFQISILNKVMPMSSHHAMPLIMRSRLSSCKNASHHDIAPLTLIVRRHFCRGNSTTCIVQCDAVSVSQQLISRHAWQMKCPFFLSSDTRQLPALCPPDLWQMRD